MSPADSLWGPAHSSENTHRPSCCVAGVLKYLVHVGPWCTSMFVCVCACTCWAVVDRMRGWMSYFVCLSQWITLHAATLAFTQAFTHTDTCTWIHCIPLAMFGESKPRSKRVHCAHIYPTDSTKLHRHTHFLPIISIFLLWLRVLAPAVKFLRSYSATENRVFTLLTVFGIQKNSWGGDGCSTNAHKQHKQKGYKIFMGLKQGREVQCKQII